MENKTLLNLPVVIISGNSVTKYYTSVKATLQDGFDPYKVMLVCVGARKTHKRKQFRFASEVDIIANQLLKELSGGGGEKQCNI